MTPFKVLAIKFRALGDTVLLTAPLLELHRLFPQSTIHVAAPQIWAPLLEGLPGVTKIWPFEAPSGKIAKARSLAQLALSLRKEKFDSILNFHASTSSALFAWAIGAPVRLVHFHDHRRRNCFATLPIPDKGILKPITERDLDVIRAMGVSIPPKTGATPRVFLHPLEIQEARSFLASQGLKSLTEPSQGPLLGINLGASRPTKSWPIPQYAALAVQWVIRNKGSVLALAGPNEEVLTQAFLENVQTELLQQRLTSEEKKEIFSKIKSQHRLSVRTLAAVLSQLSVVVGNDSGPKHLAIAVGVPTVTLFGPEDPYEWHPYSSSLHPYFFIQNLPCRRDAQPGYPAWCGLQKCTLEAHRCMLGIDVDSVLKKCEEVARE